MQPSLPYRLPETVTGQIDFLCQLIGLPRNSFNAYGNLSAIPDDVALEILTGIVLYHHLHRHEQSQVLRLIHQQMQGRPAISHAIAKITDPMVNPMWGLWAKTTAELEADLEFSETVSSILGLAGAGFSVPSLYQMTKKSPVGSRGPGVRTHPVLLVMIWGFYYNHDAGRKEIQQELVRRARSH
ncbi:hypothetical protein Q3O60_08600 [Alkalimonas collagenimarina]|uniref:Uncharacterized protein n=1 Tax=Alkalimonas collagenimarina TaxID=400390 RepID=A0ABT9GZX9_9GAMM|nr:hypothetical protein [Alkalimonas collagenimarina]MDP4536245.1 hypothetical protein [Alkalimonas collagenimarina]